MSPTDVIVLMLSGALAGVLNAIAGGGTFLTFPALVYVGLPSVSANASATLAAFPGYLASSWAFRTSIRFEGSLGLLAATVVVGIGGAVGGLLLISTSEQYFEWIVPWLLLTSTAVFALRPTVMGCFGRLGDLQPRTFGSVLVLLLVAIYGGYFNGGLGIVILATLGLLGINNIHGMNGLKNLFSAAISLVAVGTFILAGLVAWKPAAVVALSSAFGGYLGARISRGITNDRIMRCVVVIIGATMSAIFFLR